MLKKIGLSLLLSSLVCMAAQSSVQAYGGFHAGYTHVGAMGVNHAGFRGNNGPYSNYGIGTGYTYRDLGYPEYRRSLNYGGYPRAPYMYGGVAPTYVVPSAPVYTAPQASPGYVPPNSAPNSISNLPPGATAGYVVPGSLGAQYAAAAENATTPTSPTYVYSPSYSKGLTTSSGGHGLGTVQ